MSWSTANPSVTSASDRSIASTRSATRPWCAIVSCRSPPTRSAVDSSIRVKRAAFLGSVVCVMCPFFTTFATSRYTARPAGLPVSSDMDPAALGALDLPDSTGTPRRLGDYWVDRPVVLVFLRHFG